MDNHSITLNIATPAGAFTETFPKTTKVEEVIKTAIHRMKLDPHEHFDLVHNGQVLEPVERPLVSFGLKDGDKVELVATGSGV